MVQKFPSNLQELKKRRERVPYQEELFFNMTDVLDDSWYVWHSVSWDDDSKRQSSEADFLIFKPDYGYIVIEVKGGTISVNNGTFCSQNHRTLEINPIKDPFEQARKSMHHIRVFYESTAKQSQNPREVLKNNNAFPLSFNFAVFFPDCHFKKEVEYLQLKFNKIFDQSNCEEQTEWMGSDKTDISPLEKFLLNLLEPYKKKRVLLSGTSEFFIKMIGSNISKFISMKKYLDLREQELEEVNQVQDFLLNSLSQKHRCFFKGSAGSGKTFIAMKKALLNYRSGLKTLFLCFNAELRDSIQQYFCEQIDENYVFFQNELNVQTINSFLRFQIKETYYGPKRSEMLKYLNNFEYLPIATSLKKDQSKIYKDYKYDAIIVDEAQDIDINLWDLFDCFLKDPPNSLLYIFYDELQAIFVEDFSVEKFRMDPKRDLILLTKNLRNTIEIAKWLENRIESVKYQKYSGILGFKISVHSFADSHSALMTALNILKSKYYSKNIELNRIAILSYNKLKNVIRSVKNNNYCDYAQLHDKTNKMKENVFVVSPNRISELPIISKCPDINSNLLVLFKTISGFKGLERDVIFLLVPNLTEFRKRYPNQFDNLLMQVYVGASRAKFKLYFFEYSI